MKPVPWKHEDISWPHWPYLLRQVILKLKGLDPQSLVVCRLQSRHQLKICSHEGWCDDNLWLFWTMHWWEQDFWEMLDRMEQPSGLEKTWFVFILKWFKCESFTELDTTRLYYFFHNYGHKRGLSQMLQTDGKLSFWWLNTEMNSLLLYWFYAVCLQILISVMRNTEFIMHSVNSDLCLKGQPNILSQTIINHSWKEKTLESTGVELDVLKLSVMLQTNWGRGKNENFVYKI